LSRRGAFPPGAGCFLLVLAFLFDACASLGDSWLLVAKVSDADKSSALTVTGIAEYDDHILRRGDISSIAAVERFFDAALRLNPSNTKALRYRTMVSDFRTARLKANVNAAWTLGKKPKRTEAENYALVTAIRRAESIDASDDDVRGLLKETAALRKDMVSAYLEKASFSMKGAERAVQAEAREKAWIDAFRNASLALEVEPSELGAVQIQRDLKGEISKILQGRIAGMESLFVRNAFAEARAQLGMLKELNAKLGGAFDRKILDTEYRMYLKWAGYWYAERDLEQAEGKVDAALDLRKGSEAAALKKRIADDRGSAERGADFQAGLSNIDSYLAKGQINKAYRVVAALTAAAKTQQEKNAVNQRRERIIGAAGTVYERGVALYRDEKFREAISELELVVSIDPGYLDAMDYLEKAREKQKLLDQFD